ncbi:MAG: tRNA (N6-isopentenyl adenosine(37)-C2)-methylthiotransferase MiaB [Fimbriimonadales bacterium]
MAPVVRGGPKFHIETWGCQMNVLDSQRMAGMLESHGYEPVDSRDEADVLVLNTCDVREKAEWKVYSELGRLNQWKRERAGRLIGLAGCLAQRLGSRILENIPAVDLVVGTGNVERLPEAVENARRQRVALLDLPTDSPAYQFRSISRPSKFQAFVTVIEGCDQFCTFCVVPFTRGRERSRRACEIEQEVRLLAESGFTEITLLGQTVNAYSCPDLGLALGGLLTRLSRIEGVRRLRFLTSHPAFVTDDLIEALADTGSIAPFFHLPAQSGSDRILARMKRRYTSDQYRHIVDRVRRRVPRIEFSSDFIVGFPGESDADFDQTMRMVAEVRFASLFAFLYSCRPGTAAARWGDRDEVARDVASARLERLFELQRSIQREDNRRLEGSDVEVLIDGESNEGLAWTGRTACNRVVHIDKDSVRDVDVGAFVHARVQRALEHSLIAASARG